jgi:hypothetical protein
MNLGSGLSKTSSMMWSRNSRGRVSSIMYECSQVCGDSHEHKADLNTVGKKVGTEMACLPSGCIGVHEFPWFIDELPWYRARP